METAETFGTHKERSLREPGTQDEQGKTMNNLPNLFEWMNVRTDHTGSKKTKVI